MNNQVNSSSQLFTGSAYLTLTFFFERVAYYGIRTCFLLYLVDSIDISQVELGKLSFRITNLVYILPLIVSPILDFVLKPRQGAIVGGAIMLVGCLLLLVPTLYFITFGFICIGLGSSFIRLGTSSSMAHLFQTKDNRRDLAFGSLYLVITLAALIGSVGFAYLVDVAGYLVVFSLGAFIVLLAMTTMLVGNLTIGKRLNWVQDQKTFAVKHPKKMFEVLDDQETNECQRLPEGEKRMAVFSIIWIYLAYFTFWSFFAYDGANVYDLQQSVGGVRYSQFINPLGVLVSTPLVLILLYSLNKKRFRAHFILLGVISLVLVWFSFFMIKTDWSTNASFMTFTIGTIVAEVIFIPFMGSYVSRLWPRKLTNLALGMMYTSLVFSNLIFSQGVFSREVAFTILSILSVFLVIIGLLIRFMGIRKETF